MLPLLGSVLYFGMNQSIKIPHLFNYVVTITKENAERHYEIAVRTIRLIKLSMLIILTAIIVMNHLAFNLLVLGRDSAFISCFSL